MLLLLLSCRGPSCPSSPPELVRVEEPSACQPVEDGERIRLCPEPALAELSPDVGISTFHESAEAADPDYLAGPVMYQRFWWRELWQGDRLDLSPILEALAAAEAADQDFAFRVMPEGSGEVDLPPWLIEAGVDGISRRGRFFPNYDDEVYLAAAESFIAELGVALNGHPRLAYVDVSLVGEAGEWHVGQAGAQAGAQLPRSESWERILDAHLAAFPDTPLLMLVGDVDDGGAPLRYAVERGMGWRADCLGDNSRGWNHMDDYYLQRVEEAGAEEVWKTAPVHFESCGDFRTWSLAGAEPSCQLDYALGLHASGLNAKSRVPPKDFAQAISDFEEGVGYRLRLLELDLPAQSPPGADVALALRWHNAGVAPPYRDFRVAIRVDGQVQILGSIQGWLPGESTLDAVFTAPAAPGRYPLELAILGPPGEDSPRVPMGLAEQDGAAWVSLATLQVSP